MFNDYYKNKHVLVTGHTGFKGSWLTLWLLELGAKVAGFSAYLPSEPCNFEVLGLKELIKHYDGDIRNFHELRQVFEEFQPDVVFHLAAQSIVRRSYDEPKLTFDTNLGGTVNILECLKYGEYVQVAVIITSDKCYKNVEWIWGYRENDPLGGDDPYSASKGCAEIAINSYCQCYFNAERRANVASTRAGNVIGGGDWAEDRIVPDCMRAWAKGQEVVIRNPHATRPWQYVLEPLSGYLWLGSLLGHEDGGNRLSGEGFNFGPRSEFIQPVSELVNILATFWADAQWKNLTDKQSRPESALLKLSCDKALSLLDWQAILSFKETVEFTALWYKKYYEDSKKMLELSKQQIQEYCSLAKIKGMEWAKSK
jgi:CDP-glucose 4,6-dehydratase